MFQRTFDRWFLLPAQFCVVAVVKWCTKEFSVDGSFFNVRGRNHCSNQNPEKDSHSNKTTATPAKEWGKLKYFTRVGVVLAHQRNEKIYGSRSYRKIGNRTTTRTPIIIEINRLSEYVVLTTTRTENIAYDLWCCAGVTTMTTTTRY